MINSSDGSSVASQKLHSKYVVSTQWAPGGGGIVSASWDGNVVVSGALFTHYTARLFRILEQFPNTNKFRLLFSSLFLSFYPNQYGFLFEIEKSIPYGFA